MASRQLPGLGLTAFYDLGEDGWNETLDLDLRKLSALVGLSVLSVSAALPGAPTDGQITIVPASDPTNPKKVAIRDEGAWVFLTPKAGWRAWALDTGSAVVFDGSEWVAEGGSGGGTSTVLTIIAKTASHTLVLADAGCYLRMNVATDHILTVPPNTDVAFPVGTVIQLRQVGAGQTELAGGVGVTLNTSESLLLRTRGSSGALVKVGADEWDLTGDMELSP